MSEPVPEKTEKSGADDAEMPAAPKARNKPSRRVMLKVAAVAAAGAVTGAGGSAILNRLAGSQKSSAWKVLTDAEAALLAAVCEQIIPTDQDPGARDAGCVIFIDRQLAGTYRRYLSRYRSGMASLQSTAKALHNVAFEQLGFDQQTRLLEQVESGRVPKEHWTDVSPAEFFRLVRDHTMQGFYGSPRHGGNKDYASYKMLGLEYPRVIGRNKYGA